MASVNYSNNGYVRYSGQTYSLQDWQKLQNGQETIEGIKKREFVAELMSEGKKPREIARALFNEGYTSAKTKGQMSLSSVYHIMNSINNGQA